MSELLFQLSDIYNDTINFNCYIVPIIGQIISNKIAGIAFPKINKYYCSKAVYHALEVLYINNLNEALLYRNIIAYLSNILANCKIPYAFIKGSFLISALYQPGQRTANDIDILVNERDIGELQSILKQNGFQQGYFNGNLKFFPADRSQILMSRMNYGETVPWVKLIDGRPVTVDLNFSVDYKPNGSNDIVRKLLEYCTTVTVDDYELRTLAPVEFFIHLCCYLYKEATTYDWVRRRKDLMLYKFSDINVFLHKYGKKQFFEDLTKRVRELGVEKACYYTCKNSFVIYPHLADSEGFKVFLDQIKPEDLLFMNQIIHPQEKKIFNYDMDFVSWFFCEDRMAYLNGEAKCEKI